MFFFFSVSHSVQRSNRFCLGRENDSRVKYAMLHNLSRLRTMQRSPHPYRVVLNALEKGFVEQELDSSTRKHQSMIIRVVT